MYIEPQNKTYTESDVGKVSVSDNSDFSISGTSKRINYTNGTDAYLDVDFDPIDLDDYEEFCFYLYSTPLFHDGNIVKITIGGQDFEFSDLNENRAFHFIRLDTSVLTGPISKLRITSLVPSLILFFDFPLIRKVNVDSMDTDVLKALANDISLDYAVETQLSSAVLAGAKKIALKSINYIRDYALLKIKDGATEELVMLESRRTGDIKGTLVNAYPADAEVTVQVPIKYGHENEVESDPFCGIVVVGKDTRKVERMVKMDSGSYKKKLFLGELILMIYIEATAEEKVLYMSRQFDRDFGDRFEFILDGERVDAYLEDSAYVGKELGGLARMTYTYNISPQPITEKIGKPIDDLTLNVVSKGL